MLYRRVGDEEESERHDNLQESMKVYLVAEDDLESERHQTLVDVRTSTDYLPKFDSIEDALE